MFLSWSWDIASFEVCARHTTPYLKIIFIAINSYLKGRDRSALSVLIQFQGARPSLHLYHVDRFPVSSLRLYLL